MFNDENEQDDKLFFETVSYSCNDLALLDNNNLELINKTEHFNMNENTKEEDSSNENHQHNHHHKDNSTNLVIDIDNYICNFVDKAKLIYFANDLDKLDQLLKDTFHQFYFLISTRMYYFIQKLKLFKLLCQGQFDEAKKFYLTYLFPLVKLTKKTKWTIKNKFFLSVIDYPIAFRDNKYLEKYFPQFENILNKSLRQYLEKARLSTGERKNTIVSLDKTNNSTNIVQSATSPNLDGLTQLTPLNNTNLLLKQVNNINEDFSDFEEELGFDLKADPYERKDTDTETLSNSSKTNNTLFPNTQSIFSKARPTNYLFTLNKVIKPKKEPSEKSLYKILPSLPGFKPNYTKRENIDKKIIRKFRQFIVELIKKKAFNHNELVNSNFWILLINGDLFPPINYYDEDTNEQVVFKSLNSHYLLWIFSKQGIKGVYEKFLKCQGVNFINSLIVDYMINDELEKKKIESYVNNLPFIFDISLLPSDRTLSQLSLQCCNNKYKQNLNKKSSSLDRSRGYENIDEDPNSKTPVYAMNKDLED